MSCDKGECKHSAVREGETVHKCCYHSNVYFETNRNVKTVDPIKTNKKNYLCRLDDHKFIKRFANLEDTARKSLPVLVRIPRPELVV